MGTGILSIAKLKLSITLIKSTALNAHAHTESDTKEQQTCLLCAADIFILIQKASTKQKPLECRPSREILSFTLKAWFRRRLNRELFRKKKGKKNKVVYCACVSPDVSLRCYTLCVKYSRTSLNHSRLIAHIKKFQVSSSTWILSCVRSIFRPSHGRRALVFHCQVPDPTLVCLLHCRHLIGWFSQTS